jgi:Lrp/AsnC family leucine-responsive transcriptional regulator
MSILRKSFESLAIDPIDWLILRSVQENARLSFAELGRRVGLSPPSAAERLRKLEDARVVTGYRAQLGWEQLGLPITVFVRIQTQPSSYAKLQQLATGMQEILEMHHVTGSESFLLKAAVHSIAHLENLLGKLSQYGSTSTSVVLSTVVADRVIVKPEK